MLETGLAPRPASARDPAYVSGAENTMHTGLPQRSSVPAGASRPVDASTPNRTMLSLSSFNTYIDRPSGASVKNRGVRPSDGWACTGRSRPLPASIEKTAMPSQPRFDA